MRERVHVNRTMKDLVADLRETKKQKEKNIRISTFLLDI